MLEAAIISLIISLCIYQLEPLRGFLEKVVTRTAQSKSAVSITIIGLVAGKMPAISQYLGDLLNIKITASINIEFMTFNVEIISIQMASIGAILFGAKKETIRQTGLGVFGLAVAIGAAFGHVTLASIVGEMAWVSNISAFLNNHFIYAAIIGAIIRSRKIALGVAAVLLAVGQIKLGTALVLFLGAYFRMLITLRYVGRR